MNSDPFFPPAPQQGMPPTHKPQDVNTALLQKLSAAVDGHAATPTFACGGMNPITGLDRIYSNDQHNQAITLRWDANGDEISKITFPLPKMNSPLASPYHGVTKDVKPHRQPCPNCERKGFPGTKCAQTRCFQFLDQFSPLRLWHHGYYSANTLSKYQIET